MNTAPPYRPEDFLRAQLLSFLTLECLFMVQIARKARFCTLKEFWRRMLNEGAYLS
jgi:hypothetical protein